MSINKLQQSNELLRSLIEECKSEPISEQTPIPDIIASVKALIESRHEMQAEYEKQKKVAENLQIQLGSTSASLQKCSSDEVPALQKQLVALQSQFDQILKELNITNELVVPLKDVVHQGHEDLKKCLAREKELLASLTPQEINRVAEEMVPPAQYQKQKEFADVREATNVVEMKDEQPNVNAEQFFEMPEAGDVEIIDLEEGDENEKEIHDLVSTTPIQILTASELRSMNPFTLEAYARKNMIPNIAMIAELEDRRNEIWDYRLSLLLQDPSITKEVITAWNRAKLEESTANLLGMLFDQPIAMYSDDDLRDYLWQQIERIHWFNTLKEKNPQLLKKFQYAEDRQMLKWIHQFDPSYTLTDDTGNELYWKAVELGVKQLVI